MDPLLTLASGCAVPVDAEGNMEYEAAGTWRGTATRLVKCETNDLLVPADAEWVIEGEIPPHVRIPEGPMGKRAASTVPPRRVPAQSHRDHPPQKSH